MILVLVNVLFFIVSQTLFFRYVASRQYSTVLKKGVDDLVSSDPIIRDTIYKYKNLLYDETRARRLRKVREAKNRKLEKDYCWSWFNLFAVCLSLVLVFTSTPWTSVDTLGLFLVIIGYTTEVIFYYTVVKRYIFIDMSIVKKLLDN